MITFSVPGINDELKLSLSETAVEKARQSEMSYGSLIGLLQNGAYNLYSCS